METLPVELLRLIYSYCDFPSTKVLREVNSTLADVGYEYLLSPSFTALSYRDDIDRLHNIALHHRLRGCIETVVINLSDLDDYDARHAAYGRHFLQLPEDRSDVLSAAFVEFEKIKLGRKSLAQFHTRRDDLREALTSLPNLKHVEVTFTQCPLDNQILREVYEVPGCRRMNRAAAYQNLEAIVFALHSVRLTSFSVDRFPLEIFKIPDQRRHWFTHAQSFASLSRLDLTIDPSGLQGPASAVKAVNGLGYLLQLPKNLQHLKLAFHPYNSWDSKFVLSFREMLNGFRYSQLSDLTLEGVSCEEEDLRDFLIMHASTLTRLRLGGRGLAKPFSASTGGIHLHEGTFKSLFTALRAKMAKLERMHLEGIFECEPHGFSSHESYNFYPLTDESWKPVPRPGWVRASRKTISCQPFEEYVLIGGMYPGTLLAQQQDD